ncbi:unnamed protein product, partial [Urochloa humidicola]
SDCLISLSLLPPGGGGDSGDFGRSRVGGRRRLGAVWPPAAAGSTAHAARPSTARGGGCDVGLAGRAHGSVRASVARKLRWWAGSSGDGWPLLPYFDLVSFTAILILIFPFSSTDSNFYFLVTAAPSPLQHVHQAWRPCQSLEPSHSPLVAGSEG